MITNWRKLIGPEGATDYERYKLRLLRHFLLEPIADDYDIIITSGRRTHKQQMSLPVSKRSKGTSQHELSEAVDFVIMSASLMEEAYRVIYETLGWWQLFIYFEDGVAQHLHMSMPSEMLTKKSKALYNANGKWFHYDGSFSHRRGT